ncbi:hypothetical protein Tco_1398130 [Tanacetum coccineum]
MAPLPPRDQRHLWLRYQVEGYTEEIVHDFEQRLETIFGRQVNRVHILDFKGLTLDMRQDLAERLRMVYTGDDGQEVFVSRAWRRLFDIRAPLVHEFLLEFFSTCRIGSEMGLDVADTLCLHTTEEMAKGGFEAYWLGSERVIPDKGDLSGYWIEISFDRGQTPKNVSATDLFYLRSMNQGTTNVPYLLAQYLFRHTKGRKSSAKLSRGHFIGRLAHHFGLVSDDGLKGLSIVTRELSLIDMVVAAVAPMGAEDALDINEGAQAVPAPIHAPPPPPPAAGRTMPQRLGRLEEEIQGLRQDVRSLRGLVE